MRDQAAMTSSGYGPVGVCADVVCMLSTNFLFAFYFCLNTFQHFFDDSFNDEIAGCTNGANHG